MGIRRIVAAASIAAFLPLATAGCFGRFELTRKVYRFNQEVSPDKWVQWLTFLALNFIPVYGIAVWVDALFANSVEFWTGTNPITADASRVLHGPRGEVATTSLLPDGSLELRVREAAGPEHVLRFVREPGGVSAWDAEGRLLGRVFDVGGSPRLVREYAAR